MKLPLTAHDRLTDTEKYTLANKRAAGLSHYRKYDELGLNLDIAIVYAHPLGVGNILSGA